MNKILFLLVLASSLNVQGMPEHEYSLGCYPKEFCTVSIEEQVSIGNGEINSNIRATFNFSGKDDNFHIRIGRSPIDPNSTLLILQLNQTQGQIIEYPNLTKVSDVVDDYSVHMWKNRTSNLVSFHWNLKTIGRIIPVQFEYVGKTKYWPYSFKSILRTSSNVNITRFQRDVRLEPKYSVIADPFEEITYNAQAKANVRLDDVGFLINQYYYYLPSDEVPTQFHLNIAYQDESVRGQIQAFWGLFGAIVGAMFGFLAQKNRITEAIVFAFGLFLISIIRIFDFETALYIGIFGGIIWFVVLFGKKIVNYIFNIKPEKDKLELIDRKITSIQRKINKFSSSQSEPRKQGKKR